MLSISGNGLALLVTLILPVVIALVTKKVTSSVVKAVLLIILNGLVVFITRNTTSGVALISVQAAFDWAITTAISLASYLGFWQQLNVNDRLAPEVGI